MTARPWCLRDRWLDDLPIDEAPLLFRMGPEEQPLRAWPARFSGTCAAAIGVAGRTAAASRPQRVYQPAAVDAGSIAAARRQVSR
jgi:hypothetical protein